MKTLLGTLLLTALVCGNVKRAPESCVFPFIYNGVTYNECTRDGWSEKKTWCSLTNNYNVDRRWMVCDGEREVKSAPVSCVFPFIYKGVTYNECTRDGWAEKRTWCSITNNYDVHKSWMECDVKRAPESCVFPFIYNGVTYNECTRDGWSEKKTWCSLTNNYNVDRRWMVCDGEREVKSAPVSCVFPFIYKGVTYNECTRDGWSENRIWCSITNNYDVHKTWMECDGEKEVKRASESCVFPFIYNGVTYNECTRDGWSEKKTWCSLTYNYNVDRRWMVCDGERQVKSAPVSCVFPFIYKGVTYNECTRDGWSENRIWCSITNNYDVHKTWMECDGEKEDKAPGSAIQAKGEKYGSGSESGSGSGAVLTIEAFGENVALRGRATQSSVYLGAERRLSLPQNAIDGNRNPSYPDGSCTHTENDYSPWWKVDLLKPHTVHSIAITGRYVVPERLKGAEIRVGNSPANHGNNNPRCGYISAIGSGATQTFQCHGMVGRYVNVVIPGRKEWLTLCEVQVFGVPTFEHIG